MNYNIEYYLRKQKEKALQTIYSVQTSATISGNGKSRAKNGAHVALPKTKELKSATDSKNFT